MTPSQFPWGGPDPSRPTPPPSPLADPCAVPALVAVAEERLERQRAFEAWLAEHPGPHEPHTPEARRTCRWADYHIARIEEELVRLAKRRRR